VLQDLVADDISPGVQLSAMLADILEDASSLHSLSLADNHLDDTAVANIMRALASNGEVQLTQLDLSGNDLLAPVSSVLRRLSPGRLQPLAGSQLPACWLATFLAQKLQSPQCDCRSQVCITGTGSEPER
jgi:hypothetical protein